MTVSPPHILSYGDCALLVQYHTPHYDPAVSDAVLSLCQALGTQSGWEEIVPGYDSVLVSFNPMAMSLERAKRQIEARLNRSPLPQPAPGKTVDIPVHYGGTHGPDLSVIAAHSGLSDEEVIHRHSKESYRVCMMGFIPGFAFLSAAPVILHHPRRDTPRHFVPAGSIGIAGWQTGIYGQDSPGGWQIIGQTDMRVFDPSRGEPFALSAGDSVRFVPVNARGEPTC